MASVLLHSGIPLDRNKEPDLMLEAHRATLSARHAQLETRIAHETQRPIPNSLLIADLKKQKLRVKEALMLERPRATA